MDPIIARLTGAPDADLVLCRSAGIAYQADMTADRVAYDDAYWAKVSAYEGSPIACRVIAGRLGMLARHAELGSRVLDIGAGTGAFVRNANDAGYAARGFDVMPTAVERLKRDGLYASNLSQFGVVTMWDAIEHMEDPQLVLDQIAMRAVLLTSLPIFPSLDRIRESRHYRPGEHLLYFTEQGFVDWMWLHGFRCYERSAHEIRAGRDSIGAFAFVRERRA